MVAVECLWCLMMLVWCAGAAPARDPKDLVWVPVPQMVPSAVSGFNPYQYPVVLPHSQLRGPFDFIGNWIQQSQWFPVEVNVPDTVGGIGTGFNQFASNVGNGFNQFTQNVGNGFQQFTQNVGNGFNAWAQNVGQRIPWLNNVIRPTPTTKIVMVVPTDPEENQQDQLPFGYYGMADDFAEAFV